MFIKRPWKSKPPPGTQLDFSHPLTKNLVNCWVFNEGAGLPINMVRGGGPGYGLSLFHVNTEWRKDREGVHIYSPNRNDHLESSQSIDPDIVYPIGAIITAFKETGTPIEIRLWAIDDNFEGRILREGGSNRQWKADIFTNKNDTTIPDVNFITGKVHTYAANYVASTKLNDLYFDGDLSYTFTEVTNEVNISNPLYIGNRPGKVNQGAIGNFYYFYMFDRVLTPIEHKSLHDNPYQIFKPRILWIPLDELDIGIEANINFSADMSQVNINNATMGKNFNFDMDLNLDLLTQLVISKNINLDLNMTLLALNSLVISVTTTFDVNLSLQILNKLSSNTSINFNINLALNILNQLNALVNINIDTNLSLSILNRLISSKDISFDFNLALATLSNMAMSSNISFNTTLALETLNILSTSKDVSFNIDLALSTLNQLNALSTVSFNTNLNLNILNNILTNLNHNFIIDLNQEQLNTAIRNLTISFNSILDETSSNKIDLNTLITFASILTYTSDLAGEVSASIIFNTGMQQLYTNIKETSETIALDIQSNLVTEIYIAIDGNITFNTEMGQEQSLQLAKETGITFGNFMALTSLGIATLNDVISFATIIDYSIIGNVIILSIKAPDDRVYKVYFEDRTIRIQE